MAKRRIVLITAARDGGGVYKQVTLLARGLRLPPAADFDIHVMALSQRGGREFRQRGADVPMTAVNVRGPCDLAGLWPLRRALKHLHPDLVHTWGSQVHLCGGISAVSAGVPNLVTTEHCFGSHTSVIRQSVNRWLTQRTAQIVAVSPHVRQCCLARGLPEEKVRVIPGGVPIVENEVQANGGGMHPADCRTLVEGTSIERNIASRSDLLTHLGLPADTRLIISAAPLEPRNRLKDILWAAELLRFIRDDAHLVVIGDGPQRALLTRYRDLIQATRNIHFLGRRENAQQLIASCDLLWHAGGHEAQPAAVMEALAAGVPVVATDTPAARELMTSGEHGYLVPVGDRAALARYANKLIDDAPLRATLGAAGREYMRRQYSPQRMIESYAALYQELLQ